MIFPLYVWAQKVTTFRTKYPIIKLFEWLVLLASTAIIIFEIYYFNIHLSPFSAPGYHTAYLFIILIGMLFVFNASASLKMKGVVLELRQTESRTLILVLILCVTPIIGAFGTANSIFLNALGHAAPWFAAIIILAARLSRYINSNLVYAYFILLPSVVTVSILFDGNFIRPYYSVYNYNKSNYYDQTESVNGYALLNGITVDAKTQKFLEELKYIFDENNFEKGGDVFGYGIPGLVYLLEGTSPGMPWYYNKARDLAAMERYHVTNKLPVFLVSENEPISDELMVVIKSKGINFPDEYDLKGEVFFPNKLCNLNVYFPKENKEINE